MSRSTDVDPVDVAVDMLREELPGFEALIDSARDQVAIRGGLPIKAGLSTEIIYHMVPRPPVIDSVFRDFREVFAPEDDRAREARHAEQRKALALVVAPAVGRIVDEIRRFAIDAVGLEPVIAERELAARKRGREEGYREGRETGRREGRAELLLEWQEAAEMVRGLADAFAEAVPDGEE